MGTRYFKYSHFNTAVFLLLLFFITEAYFKIIFISRREEPILLQVTKGLVLVISGLYISVKHPKTLWLLIVLFVSFYIGQLSLLGGFYKEAWIAFFKLMFPIVLLLFFNVCSLSYMQKKNLFLAFEYVMLFNSIIIVFGFLFEFEIFSSYLGSRFGFNGLFVTSATSSYVYCLMLVYLLSKYKKSIFMSIPHLIIIGSMFLIGTKVSYLFLACFFTIYLWKYTVVSKKKIILALLALGALLCCVYFFKYGIFNEIRQSDGLLSSLMSYRNELLVERTIPYVQEHWSSINYLFGGVSDLSTRSQMDFVDIFYFFGIVGGLVYFYAYFKFFITFKTNTTIKLLLCILLVLILLAGNFFSYPSIAIYLVVLREYLKFDEYLESNEQNKHSQHLNP